MKKMFLLLIILFFTCAISFAQEIAAPVEVTTTQETTAPATSAKPRIDIGAGYWWTSGSLDMKLYADEDWFYGLLAKKGDKVSELDYDTDAGLFIINAEAYLFWRLYADGFIGFGDIDGSQDDYDWFPQVDPDVWNLSKADATGDVTTWNINGYFRVIEEKEDKGFLDVSLGYLYYQDDIEHIKNATWVIADWEVINDPNAPEYAGLDSSDKYTFDGLRLGLRGKIRLHDRVVIKASGGIVPWLGVEQKWDWNLAGHTGDGDAEGTAFDLNVALEFRVTKNLFIEAGYKYINLDSDNGDLNWHYADGTTETTEDNWNVEAERGGFYAMGRLKI